MSELLPCPFCGNDDDHEGSPFRSGNYWAVVCGNPGCNANLDGLTKEDAIIRWNTRANVLIPDEKILEGCLIAMQTAQYQSAKDRVVIDDAMVERAYVAFFKPESHKDVDGTYGPKPAMRAALVAALGGGL